MSNPASEKLLQAVTIAKERASKAEREYDRGADRIQMMASRSIDLFGGSAVSQVADIASESRKICDSLYASYQMLIKMLDEQCRPLLDQEPDYHAVREVRDLIKWLNDESEIEINFTASLNSHSLGGVASGRYIPSIENKMIQTFWETKYDMWPGRAEAEAAERQKKMEAAEQRKREMEEKRKEEEAAYEKEYTEWKQKADVIEKRRSEELEKLLTTAKETRINEIETKHSDAVKNAAAEKADCEQKLKAEESKLASLGIFKFAEKKAARNAIETLTAKIAVAVDSMAEAEKSYQNEKSTLDAWLDKKKELLQSELEQTYPVPTEPRKPFSVNHNGVENTNGNIKQAILDWMSPGQLYTLTELHESIPELSELSNQRVAALVRQLIGCGLDRVEDKRRAYFRLSSESGTSRSVASSSDSRRSAMQIVEDGLKDEILKEMVPGQMYTISELHDSIPALEDLTMQRVSALVRQMVGSRLERLEADGKAYFRLIE